MLDFHSPTEKETRWIPNIWNFFHLEKMIWRNLQSKRKNFQIIILEQKLLTNAKDFFKLFHWINFDKILFIQDFDKLINLINFVITVKPPNTRHSNTRHSNSGQKPDEWNDLLWYPSEKTYWKQSVIAHTYCNLYRTEKSSSNWTIPVN